MKIPQSIMAGAGGTAAAAHQPGTWGRRSAKEIFLFFASWDWPAGSQTVDGEARDLHGRGRAAGAWAGDLFRPGEATARARQSVVQKLQHGPCPPLTVDRFSKGFLSIHSAVRLRRIAKRQETFSASRDDIVRFLACLRSL
eukprot:GHVT01019963.1.p1 GENE.GHVT01019963.1~~GHVT01019963.1.p1  ORF type:complete len:141 (+),score=19.68 GHVT01019963.1:1613-2035(+)